MSTYFLYYSCISAKTFYKAYDCVSSQIISFYHYNIWDLKEYTTDSAVVTLSYFFYGCALASAWMPQLKKVNLLKILQFFLPVISWPLVSLVHVVSEFLPLVKVSVDILQWFECSIKITGPCYTWLQLCSILSDCYSQFLEKIIVHCVV